MNDLINVGDNLNGPIAPSYNAQEVHNRIDRFLEIDYKDMLTVPQEPGQMNRVSSTDWVQLIVGNPIAYDAFYLWSFCNILNPENMDNMDRDGTEAFFTEAKGRLYEFFQKLPGVKPMLCPAASPYNMRDCSTFEQARTFMETNAHFTIKEMRYEAPLRDEEIGFPAKVLKLNEDGDMIEANVQDESWVAYIAFPLPQLGVMESMYMVCESDLGSAHTVLIDDEFLEGAMPDTGEYPNPPPGKCLFYHQMKSAYRDDINPDGMENGDYPNSLVWPCLPYRGVDDLSFHKWARFNLPWSSEWIKPGQFVGLLVKPMPFHIWWFQESNPFIYAGNWFETEFYTSGTVTEVYPQDDDGNFSISEDLVDADGSPVVSTTIVAAGTNEMGSRYKVKVKGEYVYARPTDFYPYRAGDEVALVKSTDPQGYAFTWMHMDLEGSAAGAGIYEMDPEELSDWIIIPVDFYNNN